MAPLNMPPSLVTSGCMPFRVASVCDPNTHRLCLCAGRFGLGFNAVYHLTDVPSFVSGDYIVMFDPHAKYLPGITPAQPGLKIAFQRANLLAQFPDAFQPYLNYGCTLREHFQVRLHPWRSFLHASWRQIHIPTRDRLGWPYILS